MNAPIGVEEPECRDATRRKNEKAYRLKTIGIKFIVKEREALECGSPLPLW
jgi:hypothetical protein